MKSYARQASVRWQGTRQRGKGTLNTPSATLKTTLHGVDGQTRRRGTTPPELIAAAVAGSFSLSLASELEGAGYKPRQIDTTATVTLEYSAARWRMTQIYVEVIATVPGAAECDFVDATLQARTNCPVSQALDVNIILSAKLTRNN